MNNTLSDIKQDVADLLRGHGFEVREKSEFAPEEMIYGSIDCAASLIETLLAANTQAPASPSDWNAAIEAAYRAADSVLPFKDEKQRNPVKVRNEILNEINSLVRPVSQQAAKPEAAQSEQARDALTNEEAMNHKLDTDKQVFFYEQDFYVLSNFSSFTLRWKGIRFDTSEAAYHWEKFPNEAEVRDMILDAPSAHEAFKIAESQKMFRRPDWDSVKTGIMRDILQAKADQHEYVRRKLLATGDRELIEDSWRDDYWGWGPNKDGQNMLGKLWMEIRAAMQKGAGHVE